jgi:hypothetical protein
MEAYWKGPRDGDHPPDIGGSGRTRVADRTPLVARNNVHGSNRSHRQRGSSGRLFHYRCCGHVPDNFRPMPRPSLLSHCNHAPMAQHDGATGNQHHSGRRQLLHLNDVTTRRLERHEIGELYRQRPAQPPFVPNDDFASMFSRRRRMVPPPSTGDVFAPPIILSGAGTAASDANVLPDSQAIGSKKSRRSTPKDTQRLVIRNRQQVIAHSRLIISALEDALDYDPLRHHNRPPPELRIEDAGYLQDTRALIAELKRLNALLETRRAPKGEPKRTVIDLKKHINNFFR